MAYTPCTVKDITLITISSGGEYRGGIDRNGNELPDVQVKVSFLADNRQYYCDNCKKTFDGRETFEEVKKHFGTFPID